MTLEEITLSLFAACNGVRIIAYVPQVLKAASDKNGATSISLTTWLLFLIANLSTVAYAVINCSDWGLAAFFAGNAVCCVAILGITGWKRRSHALHERPCGAVFPPAFPQAEPGLAGRGEAIRDPYPDEPTRTPMLFAPRA